MSRAAFLKGGVALGVLATVANGGVANAAGRRGLTYRGVCYDVGTSFAVGDTTRLRWSRAQMRGDIRAIDEGLRCNSVSVIGTEVGRLAETAEVALKRGLQVSIQPRLFDRPQQRILEHLARTARDAERLRRAHRPEVILIIGCEYILFTPGIVPGRTFLDRIKFLEEGTYDFEKILRKLQAFVTKAVAVAREHFHGRITYGAAAGMEEIDWSAFDIVGLDYYEQDMKELRPYRRWKKPIMILEFGCCTFRGAAAMGGMGWEIVDDDGEVPKIKPGYVRSEQEQADHIAKMLRLYEAEGFLGASIYQFISPDLPRSRERDHDLDMASYGLVKVIRKNPDDPASRYRWEPKKSFYAVAKHNRRVRASRPGRSEGSGA